MNKVRLFLISILLVFACMLPLAAGTGSEEEKIVPGSQMIGGDMGWIRVNCNVDGAAVSFDDGPTACIIAQGSCTKEVYTTTLAYSTFTVRKSGYTPFTGSVIWPAKGQTVDLYATLNPVPTPAYGSIQVTTSPSGAVANLDGATWQYTPGTFSSVSAGSHLVQISMSGYQTITRSVTVSRDETTYVSVTLDPNPPSFGSLNIQTYPSNADIYVDGRYISETPGIATGLAPGSHSLRLLKSGYEPYVSTVTVSAGRQTPVTVTLSAQQPSVGSIEVTSNPPGSSVYLDGSYQGTTPSGSYLDLTGLAAGYHTVLVRHTDFTDYTQDVYVHPGKVTTINAQLSPSKSGPTPDTTGQIVIASSPAGAEIYLDNAFRGISPVTLTDIAAGQHVVTLKMSGYQDSVQTVTVTGGQSAAVAATLTETAPAPTKSPVTLVPVVGAFALMGFVFHRMQYRR